MNRDTMIQALRGKFSDLALRHAVCLEKPNTYDIETLTTTEVERLYNRFFPKPTSAEVVASALAEEIELKRLRSIVLADAQFVGLYTPNNWTRFNNFMKYKSVFKQPLNAYTLEQFPSLIKQFKSIRSKFVHSKMRIGDTEWYNYFGFMTISKQNG